MISISDVVEEEVTLQEEVTVTLEEKEELGNNSKLVVSGKGNIRFEIDGITQTTTDVFFVPLLTTNLLSVGKLQEKGVTFVIGRGLCKIYHPQRGLVTTSQITPNRMFKMLAVMKSLSEKCLQVAEVDTTDLWHKRYGHLNNKSIRTMKHKQMVKGLPDVEGQTKLCEICNIGKQHREAIPKKSEWRATGKLQLIHTNLCGPISPISWSATVQVEQDEEEENGVEQRTTRRMGYQPDPENLSDTEGSPQVRNRRQPFWMDDYESGEGLSEDEVGFAMFISHDDPINFEEAAKEEKWVEAMK
nr:retrovirus-related Pol polyprotein from transposon TNT 1-94 [Tanacetum cinerariifolium]